MTKFVGGVEYSIIDCGCCGGTYAITERHRSWCYENAKSWTCPYCKTGWGFSSNNDRISQLKKEIKAANRNADLAWHEASENRKQAEKITRSYNRVRERVKNGVCPCCSRTFENLARHMQSKHPDFGTNKQLRTLRLAYGMTQAQLSEEIGLRSSSYVSLYERGMELPKSAQSDLERWVAEQTG